MKAVIFDLDGTLIDSAPDLCEVANTVLAEMGGRRITLEQARNFIGNGAGVFVKRMIAATGLPEDTETHRRLLGRFLDLYNSAVNLSTLYPGVREALELLATEVRLGVCTNKPMAPAEAVLAHFGIRDLFEVVVGGDSLPQTKPDPAPLLECARCLGASEILYVGDSEIDAETAERAGVAFALFTEGYRKLPAEALPHNFAFTDFADLPSIFRCAVPLP